MQWRLILEEYGPDLQYIKGENNIVADALSCLDLDTSTSPLINQQEIMLILECYDTFNLTTRAMRAHVAQAKKCPITCKSVKKDKKHMFTSKSPQSCKQDHSTSDTMTDAYPLHLLTIRDSQL